MLTDDPELAARGFRLAAERHGFTESHHLAIDARGLGGGREAARRLARAGVLLSEIGFPEGPAPDPAGGLRIGTQSLVRQGFDEGDAAAIAAPLARVLLAGEPPERVAPAVAAVRRRRPAVA